MGCPLVSSGRKPEGATKANYRPMVSVRSSTLILYIKGTVPSHPFMQVDTISFCCPSSIAQSTKTSFTLTWIALLSRHGYQDSRRQCCLPQLPQRLRPHRRPQRATKARSRRDRQGAVWMVPRSCGGSGRYWFLHRRLRHLRHQPRDQHVGSRVLARRESWARPNSEQCGYRHQGRDVWRNGHWSSRFRCCC